ncbi:MAG: alkaline phosphatase D family protein [Planctomycetaceae bacterium]
MCERSHCRVLQSMPLCLLLSVVLTLQAAADVFTAQGCFSGEVTATGVLLQTRLTAIEGPELDASADIPGATGVVCFEYFENERLTDARRSPWVQADPASDFIARVALTELRPATTYYYRPIFGETKDKTRAGKTCRFKTLPGGDSDAELKFCVGSCMNYNKFMHGALAKASGPVTATEEDKRLGYPAFVAMSSLEPDFFIGTGDIVYYDNILNGPAQTIPELRQCWHEQFRFPRLIEFFSRTPGYWSKDDHDFRFDDADRSKERLPLPQTGIELFREQLPIHRAGDHTSPTYRTHRLNKHLQVWLTEGRDYRSPNRADDGPDKTLWGKEQREWLQSTLKASDATWKILISPTPMVGPDDARKIDNHTNLGGFRHEANEFFDWIQANHIQGFMTFCGDRHWQYHSIHPTGVEEFACGALNDENARRGVKPGAKNGTDPDALIRQPYTYGEVTGGFLYVSVRPDAQPKLVIEFWDDQGKVLHRVSK